MIERLPCLVIEISITLYVHCRAHVCQPGDESLSADPELRDLGGQLDGSSEARTAHSSWKYALALSLGSVEDAGKPAVSGSTRRRSLFSGAAIVLDQVVVMSGSVGVNADVDVISGTCCPALLSQQYLTPCV